MIKAIWLFKKYYILKEDLLYYKKRHDELNELLNERNKELNKYKLEIQRLWEEKVKTVEHITSLQSKIQMLEEEKNRLAETVSLIDEIPEKDEPVKDKGIILELDEDDLDES